MPVHLSKALEGLAHNPALPAGMARRLIACRRGFGEVAKRPDLTDDLIDETIATDWHWLLHSLALNRELPDPARTRLARHPDVSIRTALAIGCDRGAAREVFELLSDDADAKVRQPLAKIGHVPPDLRAGLAADPDPEVRATLARWWVDAPEDVRRRLLTDADDKVRAAACATYYARLPHPVPPPDLVPALLADPVTRAGAIRHTSLDHETAARLAADPDPDVRAQVAEHPALPPALRDLLATDAHALVRLGVFVREDTPEPLRSVIHAGIEAAPDLIDLDPDLDDDALELEAECFAARVKLSMLRLDWVTADPLPHVDSPYPCFRASAAAGESLPARVVARLLDDEDNHVCVTMAKHAPHLVDGPAAERIDREFRPVKHTSWRPADVLTFEPEVLRRFATDPDPRMRCLAPRDPELPAGLAAELATDPDHTVRRAVAGHRSLPVEYLVALLSDEDEWTAHAAACSPRLPVEQMERLLALAGL